MSRHEAPSWILRLYPRRYRQERAEEVMAVHGELVAGAGRFAVLRATADVCGYALRLRTGFASMQAGGRTASALAPYALALAAVVAAAFLAVWPLHPLPSDGPRSYAPLAYAPWLAALVCALRGRWQGARGCAAVALLCAALSLPLLRWTAGPSGVRENLPVLAGLALAALVVLAVPPDLPLSGRGRRTTGLTALALGVPMVVGSVMVFHLPEPGTTVDSRIDPLNLLLHLAFVVLAFPVALALGRSRWCVPLSLALGAVCFWQLGMAGAVVRQAVPYAAGDLLMEVGVLTAVAALLIHLVRRFGSRSRSQSSEST